MPRPRALLRRDFTTSAPNAPPRLFGAGSAALRRVITSVDCHCGGLPARVLVDGAPEVRGQSADELRLGLMRHHDWLRTLMLTEPRGYPCQNLNVIFPPTPACPEAMSGHNTICVATALLESGMVPMVEPLTEFVLEAPAGPIRIRAECRAGKCERVTFRNAPAFARPSDLDLRVLVPRGDLGAVTVDVAYGGMWYAIVDASSLGLRIAPSDASELVRVGEMIKIATAEQHAVHHPTISDPGWNASLRGPPNRAGNHASNAVIMSTGHLDWDKPATWTGNIDRSPCGTGTSAIMAVLRERGELALGEEFRHEGILGSVFSGRLVEEVVLGRDGPAPTRAYVPEISGQAWVTQYSKVVVDPSDPFPCGFTLGDIWADSRVLPRDHTDMSSY